ncbi:MAG: hypothetical protein AAFX87_27310 [Bacteroidota bacterium]
MSALTIAILLTFSGLVVPQESLINSEILSVNCDEDMDPYRVNTRLTADSITANGRLISFTTTATCCVSFELEARKVSGDVKISLKEYGDPCECICAYDFTVLLEDKLDTVTKFYVGIKPLEKDIPGLMPLKKRYFVFENDTTGFDDENGLRQGFVVFKTKNLIKKVYYKDGEFIKFEIWDLNKKLIKTETDESKILDY